MKYLKLFEDYIISGKTQKEGSFGPEYDKWYRQSGINAEQNNWNDWRYEFDINNPKKILFIVSEKRMGQKVVKGSFDLNTKKGEFILPNGTRSEFV